MPDGQPVDGTERGLPGYGSQYQPSRPQPNIVIPAGSQPHPCRSCDDQIYFVQTAKKRFMPVSIRVPHGTAPTSTADGKGIAHFANCPGADKHRRPR